MQPISFIFFILFNLFIFQLSLVSVHFPARFVHSSLVIIAFSVSFREFELSYRCLLWTGSQIEKLHREHSQFSK